MTSPTRSDKLATPEAAPTHHIHRSSDPVRGQTPQDKPEPCQEISPTAAGGGHHDKQRPEAQPDPGHPETQPDPASGETRPADIKRKAGFTDRIIGKTEQIVGRIRKSTELEERGKLRESEGKAAVVKDTKPT
ncbi:hypothetical protein JB92DRAFT_3095962 [Gautieria morchelliformis]|nr:hypothetical protein JB92DRAFT_3095962 [Gautieria morchelliformis]